MDFARSSAFSPAVAPRLPELQDELHSFFARYIHPGEESYHRQLHENRRNGDPFAPVRVVEELKPKASVSG